MEKMNIEYIQSKFAIHDVLSPPLIPSFKLPIIEAMLKRALLQTKSQPLRNTAIFYVHHPLQTSVNLIDAIIRLGAKPKNIFILGKHYSECTSVVKQMIALGVHYQPCSEQIGLGKYAYSFIRDINWLWSVFMTKVKDDIKEILVLDHGGHALAYLPPILLKNYKVVGIEKTSAGLMNINEQGLPPFPLLGVANCATKKFLESPLIANAIVSKLEPLIPINKENLTCGVVGFGAIGKALTNKLLSLGHKVIVHDIDSQELKLVKYTSGAIPTSELSALISYADYIFGCSGHDITKTVIDCFRLSTRDKTLISCSSEDKEFLSLIQFISQTKNRAKILNPLDKIEYYTDMGAVINILRGGFPVNFDGSEESVPAQDIQLTRALVLTAILQAIQVFKNPRLINKSGLYALDPKGQYFIVHEWLKYQNSNRYPIDIICNFHNIQWISDESAGFYEPCDIFECS